MVWIQLRGAASIAVVKVKKMVTSVLSGPGQCSPTAPESQGEMSELGIPSFPPAIDTTCLKPYAQRTEGEANPNIRDNREVWPATTPDGRAVFVKSMTTKTLCASRSSRREVTREVTAHLHLRHKYIVPLLAAYTEDGRFFMIFENGGVTLQSLWQPRFGCKMREPMRGMMRNLLTGLAYIHENGYVHGDVKLLNTVILDGVCRLIDMGSAHEIGTPAPEATAIYFAPEVATEVVAAVANGCTDYDEVMARAAHLMQPAIDNYAAGLACVNMLMGEIHYSRGRQPPAPGAAPLPVPAYLEEEVRAARVIVANPYPWHKHPKWHEVDPDLRDVIDALCNPDPKLRATAAEALRMPFLREGAELHEAEAAQPCASPAAPATPGATDAPAAPAASCGGGGGSGASECGGCDAVVIIHAAPQLLKAPAADACAASGVATPAPAETTPVEPSFASATGSRLNADIGTTTSGGSSSSGSSLPAAAGPAAPQSAKRRPLIARALHRCHKRASEAKERVSCAVDAAASSAWACMRPKVAC